MALRTTTITWEQTKQHRRCTPVMRQPLNIARRRATFHIRAIDIARQKSRIEAPAPCTPEFQTPQRKLSQRPVHTDRTRQFREVLATRASRPTKSAATHHVYSRNTLVLNNRLPSRNSAYNAVPPSLLRHRQTRPTAKEHCHSWAITTTLLPLHLQSRIDGDLNRHDTSNLGAMSERQTAIHKQ